VETCFFLAHCILVQVQIKPWALRHVAECFFVRSSYPSCH
jgi:hypothetical protein